MQDRSLCDCFRGAKGSQGHGQHAETGADRTEQERTGQARTRQDKIGQDCTGRVRSGQQVGFHFLPQQQKKSY